MTFVAGELYASRATEMGALQQQKAFFGSMPITRVQGAHLPAKPNQKESSIAFAETLYDRYCDVHRHILVQWVCSKVPKSDEEIS